MEIACEIKKSKNSAECKKRYIRNPIRNKIANELLSKGAESYRTEKASEKMKPGDKEPPTLPKASTLRVIKSQQIKANHLHEDPRKALEIMKYSTWINSIHNIGHNPFFVHFWTTHQRNLYLNHEDTSQVFV